MSERVDAAAKALLANNRPTHPNWDEWTEDGHERWREQVYPILDAADAVMFSEEAVEWVTQYLAVMKFPKKEWGDLKTSTTEYLRECARAIIAALKEDK